ncbi:hypothetical protein KI387_002678, partial [Taxus chinensis]
RQQYFIIIFYCLFLFFFFPSSVMFNVHVCSNPRKWISVCKGKAFGRDIVKNGGSTESIYFLR